MKVKICVSLCSLCSGRGGAAWGGPETQAVLHHKEEKKPLCDCFQGTNRGQEGQSRAGLMGTRKSSAQVSPACLLLVICPLLHSPGLSTESFLSFSMAFHCPPTLKFLEPLPCQGADFLGPESKETCFSSSVQYCLTRIPGFIFGEKERERERENERQADWFSLFRSPVSRVRPMVLREGGESS